MTEVTNEQLAEQMRQIQQAILGNKEKPKVTVTNTQNLFDSYLKSRKLSHYTVTNYTYFTRLLVQKLPIFPTEANPINEYLANLCFEGTDKPVSYHTKRDTLTFIKSLLHFAVKNYHYPDYKEDLTKFHQKDPHGAPRPIRTPEELQVLINSARDGQNRLIILTLIDSGCRIGELGFAPDHPGLTVDRIYPDREVIEVIGKTGHHDMHCSTELCELLIQNSSPNGAVFHTSQCPTGLSDRALAVLVHRVFKKAFKTGRKLGAHTIRHSVATFLADLSGKPLVVQDFLKHASVDMSMEYVHIAENRKKVLPSPLKLMGQELHKNDVKYNDIKPPQLSLPSGQTSTELATIDIEHVEGQIDLSESMFKKITNQELKIRPQLNSNDLEDMREAFIYYTKTAAITNPIPGRLSRLFNRMLQKSGA